MVDIGPKIVVVRIRSTQTKNARKASKRRATLCMRGQMSIKGATRRLRQHICIAPAKCSKFSLWSGPSGLGGCAPGWAPPRLQNRTPPPSKTAPHRTRKSKKRGQKTGQFLGPENGPKNGSVLRLHYRESL